MGEVLDPPMTLSWGLRGCLDVQSHLPFRLKAPDNITAMLCIPAQLQRSPSLFVAFILQTRASQWAAPSTWHRIPVPWQQDSRCYLPQLMLHPSSVKPWDHGTTKFQHTNVHNRRASGGSSTVPPVQPPPHPMSLSRANNHRLGTLPSLISANPVVSVMYISLS